MGHAAGTHFRWTVAVWGPAVLGAAALAGCAGEPAEDEDAVVDVETDPSDTEDFPPLDTDRATDRPPPQDSDTGTPHTDGPVAPPPASWGGGLVDLTDLLTGRIVIEPGSSTESREPGAPVVFFADLDDDGVTELVNVRRWGPGTPVEDRQARVWHWTAAGLEADATLADALEDATWSPWRAADVDGDGHTDLLVEGDVIRWARPEGGWDPPVKVTLPTLEWRPTFGHGLFDLDDDGWLDLLFTSDGCFGTTIPLIRTGPRTFAARSDLTEAATEGIHSRAMLSFRLRNGEQVHYDMGEACLGIDPPPAFLRVSGRDASGYPRLEAFDAAPDAWWRNLPAYAGLPISTVEPMGTAVTDLDGDGLFDLVASLGLQRQAVLLGVGDGTFTDPGPTGIRHARGPTAVEFPWSVGVPDLDQDGRPDVVITVGDDETSFMAEQGHLMHNQVWWNAGDLDFVDVTHAIGLGTLGSWRGLGLGDPDGDGDADLVIGGQGRPSRIYRNDVDTGNHGFSLRLRGTTSGPSAPGARVEVTVDGLPLQTLAPGGVGNPRGVSEPLVFVGLGQAEKASLVRIIWPSGYVQEIAGLTAGRRHDVVEPALITVLDEDRAVDADGSSTIQVQILPHSPTGDLDVAKVIAVTLSLEGAPATVVGGVTSWSGPRVVTLRAPEEPGSTRLVVTMDGKPLTVRPRLTWR